MEDVATIAVLRSRVAAARGAGKRIGFVPTMGFLHAGHLALVDDARAHADVVVMSVFVNPLQFAPGEDFERYPRDLDRDRELARSRGVDMLFTPSADEMYAAGRELRIVSAEIGARWEGAVRPHHFDGVLTVVAKLLNIVQPDVTSFGQKDIQQVTLVRRLIGELNLPVALRVVPTVRDADGLALSSRNSYLTPEQRTKALALVQGLRAADALWRAGERRATALQQAITSVLTGNQLVADYIAVVEAEGMVPVEEAAAGAIVALAVRVGATRLIDNIILGTEKV